MRSLEPASLSAELMARGRATAAPAAGKNGDITHLFAGGQAPQDAPSVAPAAAAAPVPPPTAPAQPEASAPPPALPAPPVAAPVSALARLEERLRAGTPAGAVPPRRDDARHHIIWFGSEAEVRRSALPAPPAETPLMAALPRSLYGVLQKIGICRPRD